MFRYDPAMQIAPAHRVVVLAQDGAYPFEAGMPARVFGAADDAYEVVLCTPDGDPIRTNAGFDIAPSAGPEALADADTVIIAPVEPYSLQRELPRAVTDALAMVPDTARIVSICTGGFTLAAAGVLDGRRATTHWQCAPLFRSWFPDVELDEDLLFTSDGRVHTSAGAAAGIDLCLHLIREDHGSELANRAARRCVVAPHRDGGQAQFIERPVPNASDQSTSATRDWALGRLQEPLSVRALAEHAHMSERTFARRFLDETGLTPLRWLTQQRLNAARELLEKTTLDVDGIAASVGYATGTSLRRHLSTALGTTPSRYRSTFRTSHSATAPPRAPRRT